MQDQPVALVTRANEIGLRLAGDDLAARGRTRSRLALLGGGRSDGTLSEEDGALP